MLERLITILAPITLTTTSDARPGATCAQVCRVSSCKLITQCMPPASARANRAR